MPLDAVSWVIQKQYQMLF